MAFLTAMESRIFGGGMDLGNVVKNYSAEGVVGTSDATVINDTGRQHTMGVMSGSYKADGFISVESVEALADGSWDMVRRAFGANVVHIAAPVGDAVGYPAVGIRAGTTKAAVMPSVGETEGFSVQGETQNGFEMGVMLQPLAAKTTTYNGTAVDAGAATLLGGAAFLCWGEFAGTTVTVKIQHCTTEGGAYADYATFTDVAAARGGERIEIPVGTLNRWRRVIISAGTFTNLEMICAICAK